MDDKINEVYIADRNFMALPLESGNHEVIFYYLSDRFIVGIIISVLSLVAMVAGIILSYKSRIIPIRHQKESKYRLS